MEKEVKRRPYHSPRRIAAAAATRQAILTAARSEFLRNGYTATTIAGIAEAADVASLLQLRSAPTAGEKIELYASTIAAIHQRLAPLFLALREAATAHPELAELWSQ